MYIILLGKPMSGKGTQAKQISKSLNIPHLSTGDLLRKEVKNKTKIGKKVEPIMVKGELIPDKTIIELFKRYIPKQGAIFDGFPRDIEQAKALEELVAINLVIMVSCSDKIIIKRTIARKMCKKCGYIYGLDFPPKKKRVCDECGGELYTRKDDNEETIKHRLEIYNESTLPLVNLYKKKKIYWEVNGDQKVEEVKKQILNKIKTIKQ